MPTLALQAVTAITADDIFDYTSAQSETFIVHTNGVRVTARRDFGGGKLHRPTTFGYHTQELEYTFLSPSGAKWQIDVALHPDFKAGGKNEGEAYLVIESLAS